MSQLRLTDIPMELLLAVVLVAAPARAQSPSAASQAIDMQQYKPGPGRNDVLGVQSPQVAPHLGWNMGLSFSYAKNPLGLYNPRSNELVHAVIKDQYTLDLMGAISLLGRFELGMALPFTSQRSASPALLPPTLHQGVDTTAVGDLRLIPKAHLLSSVGGLRLGVAVPLLLPTSGGYGFLGRNEPAVCPRLLGEWAPVGGVRLLANLGINLQPQEQLYNLNVSNELAYALGAQVPFQLGRHWLSIEATLVGALGLKEMDAEERPLELLAAVRYRLTGGLAAHLAGGPGLTRGYGTPGFRLAGGLIWTGTVKGHARRRP